jgi:oxygen-independent coproporphyrinogen-3 oxidase
MELFLIDNDYKYAVEQIMLMLFPEERPVYPAQPSGGNRAQVSIRHYSERDTAVCKLFYGGKSYEGRAAVSPSRYKDERTRVSLQQRIVKLSFYRAGIKCLGKRPVWGALSGIRPTKLMSAILETGDNDAQAIIRFINLYDASPERAELCLDTAHASLDADALLEKGDICLYVGIPFCPTRCAYCSFVSQTVERSMKLIEPFVEALLQEIDATAKAAEENGLCPVALYFGGGTPTTLSPEQLDRVCTRIEQRFDLSRCWEITVEAGRPDTITEEKLLVLKRHGVTRLSVNPQTMSDHVLEVIGRRHSAADVLNALSLVRKVGGFEVNMDLIAGLPDDTVDDFAKTLDTVLGLDVENITVHTLALKKGSRITLEGTAIPTGEEVGEMLNCAWTRLREEGYVPYYLYRQKFMSGGFENVGWCRPGHQNLYNICIMEELCTILAMGGGASTKLVAPNGRIERVFAPKYPQEYIQGINKVCADKEKIGQFYSEIQEVKQ